MADQSENAPTASFRLLSCGRLGCDIAWMVHSVTWGYKTFVLNDNEDEKYYKTMFIFRLGMLCTIVFGNV